MKKIQDYDSDEKPNWCNACGDFGIWVALKQALVKMDLGGRRSASGLRSRLPWAHGKLHQSQRF